MQWLQSLDEALFRFVHESLSNAWFDVAMPWASGNPLFVPLLILTAVVLVRRAGGRALLFLVLVAVAVGVTDGLVCNPLKHAIGRLRPFAALEGIESLGGGNPLGSMPSAHAANWFAAAMVAWLFDRRSWRVMVPLAVVVSFSRVYNGVHFPSDVLVGAVLGSATACGVVQGMNGLWVVVGRKWFPLWYARRPLLAPGRVVEVGASAEDAGLLNQHWLRAGYVVLGVALVARWVFLASGALELSEDEAYQWVWSKHLAWSYYSKPLLIAVTQWLGTTLWGDTEFGVRFFSPLIGVLLGFLLLRFFARQQRAVTGFVLLIIVAATPLLTVGSTLMTVDPLAVLFWTAAMLSGWRAVEDRGRLRYWVWTGLWMGLGFLSKYTSPLQWMCWAVFFVLWPPARSHWRRPGPYLALGINLVCTLPVIVWNAQHDWITFQHVATHGGMGKVWEPTLRFLGEFLGAELALLNPVFFVAMLIAMAGIWRGVRPDARTVYFFSMGAPVLLLYVLLAFRSRVHPNWIAPAVLPMLCVMVFYWEPRLRAGVRHVRGWLIAGVVFGLALMVVLHDPNLLGRLLGHPLPPPLDPLRRVRGNRDTAQVVETERQRLLAEGRPVFLIGQHYGETSLLTFYIPEARERVRTDPLVYGAPTLVPENQYYFWPGYGETQRGHNALYVREARRRRLRSDWLQRWWRGEECLEAAPAELGPEPVWLGEQFEFVTPLGRYVGRYRGQEYHAVEIWECRGLRNVAGLQ